MVTNLVDVDPSIVKQEEILTSESPYREKYHIEPRSGILNDPNGFTYFNNEYHLFYQWTPLAFTKNPHIWHHGWYHMASRDLIHWRDLGPAIESDTNLDSHGTYSGSGLVVGDDLFLIYTGNTWNAKWQRVPYQIGAKMTLTGGFTKIEKPFISGQPMGYTSHFRDPKIWQSNDEYYAILGIQRENLTGAAIIYQSKDLQNWQLKGEIKAKYNHFGYMWECPDYFEIGDKGVLIISPQGLKTENDRYQNIYQTGYFIGTQLDLDTLAFDHDDFQELDAGFDFYASQTTLAPDGRRILSAWLGVAELHYPTEAYHYAGALVFPRELTIRHGKLIQNPVREISELRHDEQNINLEDITSLHVISQGAAQEIKINIDMENAGCVNIYLCANSANKKYTCLTLNRTEQQIILDRTHSGIALNIENGNVRKQQLVIEKSVQLDMLIDRSSVEIFVNQGELVFTARIFPDEIQDNVFIEAVNGSAKVVGKKWSL
ncbi:sucrose-6-phosphate hydrolase [Leuconostoc carnosum]|nr:sucrose-6-phosphate hydrolase [Leuconostoc carnosum]